MPINPDNQLYKIGVENLLTLPEDFPKKQSYTTNTPVDDYGAERTTEQLDKVKLCKFICGELPIDQQKNYLLAFEPLLTILRDVLTK